MLHKIVYTVTRDHIAYSRHTGVNHWMLLMRLLLLLRPEVLFKLLHGHDSLYLKNTPYHINTSNGLSAIAELLV